MSSLSQASSKNSNVSNLEISNKVENLNKDEPQKKIGTFSSEHYNYSAYAIDRPTYNPQLVDFIIDYHLKVPGNKTETVVDVATGTGIFARMINKRFDRVIATDISTKMLEKAEQASDGGANIEYIESSAERMPFILSNSVDIITVATGAHWFDSENFLTEVRRVLVPNGTLAIFSYNGNSEFIGAPEECGRILREFIFDITGPYWDKGRQILDRMYSHYNALVRTPGPWGTEFNDILFGIYPASAAHFVGTGFTILKSPVVINRKLTWRSFHSYVRTFSGVTNYNKAHPDRPDISISLISRLMKTAGVSDMDAIVDINWGQSILLCRA
ncbi:putative S-adenosylmethionine-dependent methyltransferase CRG1 [Smittium culicis]|uniref:Putative S-adenosylmethionine-dependent methyltransferase CRG1 n=1 Tax=Smittium culicis TaxID=133412 RepID=A0A1R1X761_9FUNG|nr:putative S-adenosylmethionine-dependent methyltransferase CRG1 [Smittium culicis]